jgi:predicted esterase
MATTDAYVHHFEPATDPAARTLLLMLHGTGGNEQDLLPLGRMLAPRAALLSPRGDVLENGMPRFFRRLAEGVFDLDDLRARTAAIADWIPVAAKHHGADPGRVVAVGFSNGANIAASVLLLRPDVLAGAVLLSPMVPLEPEVPPALGGRPVLIAYGRMDPIAPPAQAERLATLLRAAGADVTVAPFDGGHTVTPGTLRTAQEWLTRRFDV